MVRKVLGLALCLAMLVGALCLNVSAEEGQHSSHPICGAAHTDIGDHTGTCAAVEWTAWDGTSEITHDPTTGTAYVYLTGETTLTDTLEVKNGHKLYLCLNGKTLKGTNNVITVEGGAALNICDCQGGGEITNTSAQDSPIKVDPDYKGIATLNLYGGKVSGSVNSGGGVHDNGAVMLYNNKGNDETTAAIFNMYGGEVRNAGSNAGSNTGSGIFVSYSRVGSGFFGVNIYGGTVVSEKTYGIDSFGSSNATVLVAGGEIKGYYYAIRAIGNLKLSGSPLIHADEDEADIGITTGPASTPNNYITVADDFAPANGTTISVKKSIGITGSVLIAKPETGKQLDDKAEYFVAADEGYFVESKNGELYLTACAITAEPTAGNNYTVAANGGEKAKYQWCSVTKGDVSVTGENATAGDCSVRSNGMWYYVGSTDREESVPLTAFTLHMNAGDTLKLTGASGITPSLVDSNNAPVSNESSDYSSYQYTASAEGNYTLKVTAYPRSGGSLMVYFTATVTADVPGAALDGQTDPQLDTSELETGSYICQVTWEGKTTLSSQVVRYTVPHEHDWATEWSSNGTHHWHECRNTGCDVTDVSQKEGYGPHTGGTATCTAKAVCETCGEAYGDLDPDNHSGTATTWTKTSTTHKETYDCCGAVKTVEAAHTFGEWSGGKHSCTACGYEESCTHTGGTATCTAKAVCMTCGEAYGALDSDNHSGKTVWDTDANNHTQKWNCCGVVVVATEAHSWDTGTVTKKATCTESGTKRYTCTKCGATKDETIDAEGHNYSVPKNNAVAATCTESGKKTDMECSLCGAVLPGAVIPATGHSYHAPYYIWIGTRCTAERICANDAAHVETETVDAVVTVTQKKTCVLDELSKYEATFINTAFAKQTQTDVKTADALGHTWLDATCTEPKTCSVCQATEGDALGHSWGKWTVITAATADAEGTERRVCRNDGSHRQTRAIPKLAPAEGCTMGDDCPLCGFGDLDSRDWYHDGVHYCLENGLMQGFADGLFQPGGDTTRAQLAMILWRLEGSPAAESAPGFDDVDPDAWYIGAVRWASAEGVVLGFGDGRFAPDEAVTREQMAAILWRYAARLSRDVSAGGDLDAFADAASVSAYAVPALEWAKATGLVEGIEQGGSLRLAPGDPTTRAQMATLLLRFLTAA